MRKIQFSHIEIAGILLLSGILMAIIIILEIRPADDEKLQTIAQEQTFDSSEDVLIGKKVPFAEKQKKSVKHHKAVDKSVTRFNFDPNRISFDSLTLLGLPAKVARNLIKYRNKGGKFRSREDLRKIYGMPEKWIAEIEPFIALPPDSRDKYSGSHATKNEASSEANVHLKKSPSHAKPKVSLDVNEAGQEDFMLLPGIGQTLSKRIIKYREALGGFYSIYQIAEVYGIKDSLFQTLKDQLMIHEVKLEMININLLNIKELDEHPYIDYNLAKKIVNYREQHGVIKDAQALKKIYLVDRSVLDKVIPYFDFGK